MLRSPCLQLLSSEWDEPLTLDGHWSDHWSQLAVASFNTGFREVETTNDILSTYSNAGKAFMKSHSFSIPDDHAALLAPGRHTVSFALLDEADLFSTSPDDSSIRSRAKFKILGLKSC